MWNYIKNKMERNKIKKTFKKYGTRIDQLVLEKEGAIEFAVWENPLESPKKVTQEMVDFYKRFAPKGCLAIDIGAHIGDTTVPLALAVGVEGTTLAFDPNPYVYEVLATNSKLNRDKTNIYPYNFAIAVEAGKYFYNSSEATHNNGGISQKEKNQHGKYQLNRKVTAVNLADFLESEHEMEVKRLGFIKIDVEGLDLAVLVSIQRIIARYRPNVIAECFRDLSNAQRDQLFTLFAEMDFDLYKLNDFDANAELVKLNRKEDMRKWKHFDFCAMPRKNKT